MVNETRTASLFPSFLARSSPEQLLIVDDEVASLSPLCEFLSAAGYQVMGRVSGREALEAMNERRFDLLLTDLMMQEMDGIALLRAAHERDPQLVSIVITGQGTIQTAVDAMKAGAFDYLVKPLQFNMLLQVIARALDVRRLRKENQELREVVEVYRLKQELQESEERYRSLFENMIEGSAYCQMLFEDGRPHDFVYLGVNAAFEKLTGLKDVVGKKVTEVIPGIREADPELFEICGRVAMTGKPEKFEMFIEALKMWFSISVYSPEKEFFVAVFDVITERKKGEEKLGRLYQQVKEEAEVSASLLTMVETLNTVLDERELIKNVVNLAPRYLRFDRIGIFLYDESVGGFVFSDGYGFSPAEEGMLLSRNFRVGDFSAIDRAVKGKTLVIENAAESDLLSKELIEAFGVKAAVIVPISAREKVIGGIYGDYKTLRPIEKRDVSFLKGVADGIAIALQNSRLYRESVERLMELSGKVETIKTMAVLDREILSTIDRAAILKTAVTLVSRIIPCERAAILLTEGENYRVISEWGVGRFSDNVYSVKNSHFEMLEMKRTSLFIPDLAEDSTGCLYHKEQNAIGIKVSLLVPLITKGGIIGLLDIGSTLSGRLSPAHLSTAENIGSQITVALENARLYEELQQLLISTITSLASAIDAKSPWTKGHSERVTQYALKIGLEMGLKDEDLERLKLSGLLHDVGKIGTYDVLLDKVEKFTAEEFEIVMKHPGKGAEILSPIRQLTDVIPGILHHHERYDGKGYPKGLKGEDIPLYARILCAADSFDAMTADRPYRAAPGKDYAILELKECSGTQFDPKVVEAFLRVIDHLS
jgi:putative nucleotidyltransferase with HDIG domain/PAS domain S-box-containing protein